MDASCIQYYKTSSLLLFLIFELLICHPTTQQQTPKLSNIDENVLILIKNSLIDLPPSTFFSSWNFSSSDPCTAFSGLTCSLTPPSTLRVSTLELGFDRFGTLGLSGSLPQSITRLTELTQLILHPGLVTGPIPSELGRLVNLRVLSLAHNRLSGLIPPSLTRLRSLHTLDLGFNQLSGRILPTLLTELTQLRVLILASNRLTGKLPELTPRSQLLHLDLKSNRLVGPIPPTLPLNLRYISLSQNNLWGPITNGSLESLSQLEYLDISQNLFSGPIPSSLLRPSLSTVFLHRNNFSGVISGNYIEYPENSIIDFSHNSFSGQIPEALAGAANIYLNSNRFSGPVPDYYVHGLEEGKIKTLYLQHNFLDEFPIRNHLGLVSLPNGVEVCLSYNCMVPPTGVNACPTSADNNKSRPADQCSVFRKN
ncbi:LRR receptor-like serine/threonine-protein kinase RGI1 [Amaranthus tricolor]|uniref:LRR receptor-like serine/threonine-protein kinase RGI1 n=1 Tax=Amaranthus tricolor TaxID=29722 RepID=UPI00258B74C0|nr:LRR receptor-like serine/threonine-protein kinase RGI1 [Amaranthus tricolor]